MWLPKGGYPQTKPTRYFYCRTKSSRQPVGWRDCLLRKQGGRPKTHTYRNPVQVIISRYIGYSNFLCHGKLTKKSPSGGLRPPKGALPPTVTKNSRAVFDFWRFVSCLFYRKRIYLYATSHTKGSSPYLVEILSAEILNKVKTLTYVTFLSG